ncbi:hypothetical protein ACUR5C_08250 [Aliikangiella sp. IMCC44653]
MKKRKLKIIFFSLFGLILTVFLIDMFVIPIKKIELIGLHKIYLKGSGYDDGAVSIIVENQQRYSGELINILEKAKPGSVDEDMALTFIEYVIDQPRVREALAVFGENHPNHDTKCLVQNILSDEPTMKPVTDSSVNLIAYKAVASRFECEAS